jgi:hypothetical protein
VKFYVFGRIKLIEFNQKKSKNWNTDEVIKRWSEGDGLILRSFFNFFAAFIAEDGTHLQ